MDPPVAQAFLFADFRTQILQGEDAIIDGSEAEIQRAQNMSYTSRPSQNSASVIWPLMTRSRCNAPKSGSAMSTFLRSRKSLAESLPGITGVDPRPLDTEAALDIEGPASGLETDTLETGEDTAVDEAAATAGF